MQICLDVEAGDLGNKWDDSSYFAVLQGNCLLLRSCSSGYQASQRRGFYRLKISEGLRAKRAFKLVGQHGDVNFQAKYHVLLGADGGAWLGPAYP